MPPSEFIRGIIDYKNTKKLWPYDLNMAIYQGKSIKHCIDEMKDKGMYRLDYSKYTIDSDTMLINFIYRKEKVSEKSPNKIVTALPTYTVEGYYLFTCSPIPTFSIKITHR